MGFRHMAGSGVQLFHYPGVAVMRYRHHRTDQSLINPISPLSLLIWLTHTHHLLRWRPVVQPASFLLLDASRTVHVWIKCRADSETVSFVMNSRRDFVLCVEPLVNSCLHHLPTMLFGCLSADPGACGSEPSHCLDLKREMQQGFTPLPTSSFLNSVESDQVSDAPTFPLMLPPAPSRC